MIRLIVYGLLAAGIAAAAYASWSAFKDGIGKPYAEAQRQADQVIVDKATRAQAAAESERDNAKADTALCVSTSAKQSDAVDRWRAQADRNATAAREAKAQAQREAATAAPKIAELQAQAAAAPKLQSCEVELEKAKSVLRESLERRRGIAAPVTK